MLKDSRQGRPDHDNSPVHLHEPADELPVTRRTQGVSQEHEPENQVNLDGPEHVRASL
jgi:hypothetical protein